jgi:hypothetical protein
MKTFTRDGLVFQYPDGWKEDFEPSEDGWTLTLQGPGSAFAVVRLDQTLPEPGEMLEAALAAWRSEYRDVEVEPAMESIAGDLAAGHEVEFLSMDLPVLCWTRSFFGPAGTVLVLCQVGDTDREESEPALRAITATMRVED